MGVKQISMVSICCLLSVSELGTTERVSSGTLFISFCSGTQHRPWDSSYGNKGTHCRLSLGSFWETELYDETQKQMEHSGSPQSWPHRSIMGYGSRTKYRCVHSPGKSLCSPKHANMPGVFELFMTVSWWSIKIGIPGCQIKTAWLLFSLQLWQNARQTQLREDRLTYNWKVAAHHGGAIVEAGLETLAFRTPCCPHLEPLFLPRLTKSGNSLIDLPRGLPPGNRRF